MGGNTLGDIEIRGSNHRYFITSRIRTSFIRVRGNGVININGGITTINGGVINIGLRNGISSIKRLLCTRSQGCDGLAKVGEWVSYGDVRERDITGVLYG